MSAEGEVTLSKSARKRANQKARAAAEAAEPEPPAAPAAPAAKGKAAPKAKGAQPAPAEPAQPKAKGKAKAEPKKEAPAPAPKAESKAKAKAAPKAEAAPKAAEEPKAKGAAKPAAKASGKAAAKAKAKAEPEPPPKEEPEFFVQFDDGSGGAWELSTGNTKKQDRRKAKMEEEKAQEKAMKAAGVAQAKASQHIPGLAPAEVQLAQAKGKAKAKAEPKAAPVGSVTVVTAAAAATKEKEPEKPAVVDNNVTATVKVPEPKIGRVVGPKGANIIMIKEKTGVKTIDLAGDICSIVGLPDAVALAEHAVRQLVEKGYMALSFDDFQEDGLQVHPSVFPDIIGKQGAIIQLIKKEAGVEVDIPPVPKDSKGPKKYRVGLAGSRAGVEKGKEIINALVMYGHHELTHPGLSHQEMEIEEWRYKFLIGSKGSEMRHIQNNYQVKVNIPREFSANDKVVIVGEPQNIERAVKYIEKVMYEADQPRGRGAVDKATDDWGDEGEEEAWMSPYIYKRR